MVEERNPIRGFVLVRTEPQETKSVLRALREIRRVEEVTPVIGPFDIVARIEVQTPEELNKVVIDEVRKVKGVRETTTLLRLE